MRSKTNTFDQKSIRGEVGDGKDYLVRSSELETKAASNAKQDKMSTRADVARKNGDNDPKSGGTRTGQLLSRNASRIAVKREAQPIKQSDGPDAPLSDPKQFGPAKIEAHDWRSRGYVKSAESLGTYKKNSDRSLTDKALDRKRRVKVLD